MAGNKNTVRQISKINAADYAHLYRALYKHFVKTRGRDARTESGRVAPATTQGDVLQLATLWATEVQKVSIDSARDKSRIAEWKTCMKQVSDHADRERTGKLYPFNPEFWRCSRRVGVWLEARKARPSTWDLVLETLEELPATTAQGIATGLAAAEGAAGAAGGAVADAGWAVVGLFGKFAIATGVLLGGGLLVWKLAGSNESNARE